MCKVLLFGAGDGGVQAAYALDDKFQILAFVDNDKKKQGKILNGKFIISPNEIKNYTFDFIIISNVHGNNVKKQLVEECGVETEKIIDYFQNGMFDTRVASLKLVSKEINGNGITGSVAELGVYTGEFAKKINTLFPDRNLYLFDTFNGFTEEDMKIENERKFSTLKAGEFTDTNIEIVLGKMEHSEKCIVKNGRFPMTTIGLEDNFAFVSIDVDLYEPIYEGLKYFYPRLNKGGYIFVHDYNSTRFHGVKAAVNDYKLQNEICSFPLNDLCGTLVITK